MKLSFLIFTFCWTSLLFAQRFLGTAPTASGGALSPEQAAYDVTYYDLNIAIVPTGWGVLIYRHYGRL
jgi:hypothetical protein